MNHIHNADRHDTLGPPRWGFVCGVATVTQADGLGWHRDATLWRKRTPALRTKANPIGVAAYQLQSKLPGELKGKLPSAKQLANLLRAEMESGN